MCPRVNHRAHSSDVHAAAGSDIAVASASVELLGGSLSMTRRLHSRRDVLASAAKAAVFGVSGATGLSGLSSMATALPRPGASTAANAGLIPYGAAVQYDLLTSD